MRARSVSALLRLARWENALIAALAVVLGAWWAGWGPVRDIAFAALAAIALTVLANSWNDLADIGIDRVAHPERPLPSGALRPETAGMVAQGAAVLGVAFSTVVSAWLGFVSVAIVAVLFAYSPWLKERGLLGNLTVAVLASLPFLYGGWAVGAPRLSLELVAIAMPLHLAREVAKDLEDARADAAERRTLPVSAGASVARGVLVGALGAFLFLLAPLMSAHHRFALAIVPALALLAWAAFLVLRGARGSPAVLKLAMLCAMAAFLTARS